MHAHSLALLLLGKARKKEGDDDDEEDALHCSFFDRSQLLVQPKEANRQCKAKQGKKKR